MIEYLLYLFGGNNIYTDKYLYRVYECLESKKS